MTLIQVFKLIAIIVLFCAGCADVGFIFWVTGDYDSLERNRKVYLIKGVLRTIGLLFGFIAFVFIVYGGITLLSNIK